MKRYLHQCLLGFVLLVMVVGALLGALIAFAAIATGFEGGFRQPDFLAIFALLLPVYLVYSGARLFLSLFDGFSTEVRKRLFWYYAFLNLYVGVWLISPAGSGALFNVFGLAVLIVLFLTVLATPPDVSPERMG